MTSHTGLIRQFLVQLTAVGLQAFTTLIIF